MREDDLRVIASELFFLDTNIFTYSFDQSAVLKQETAMQCIHVAHSSQNGVISSQVVQEFLNVSRRKFSKPLNFLEQREYLDTVLLPLCRHFPSNLFYDMALDIQEMTGFALYDTLIVTAALECGCKTLFSEDLQHGRMIQGMTIINPFLMGTI